MPDEINAETHLEAFMASIAGGGGGGGGNANITAITGTIENPFGDTPVSEIPFGTAIVLISCPGLCSNFLSYDITNPNYIQFAGAYALDLDSALTTIVVQYNKTTGEYNSGNIYTWEVMMENMTHDSVTELALATTLYIIEEEE